MWGRVYFSWLWGILSKSSPTLTSPKERDKYKSP